MTTTLERLATEAKHNPSILIPNVWSELFRHIEALCPCGSTAGVGSDGTLGTHAPKSTWDLNGQRRAVIRDAFGTGSTCRYSGRTVTLKAALERDSMLTPAEKNARDVTQQLLESGTVFTAPDGYALPKPVAALFSLAEANGWATQQAWTPYDDGFRLSLLVGRKADEGRFWKYNLTYFVAPGVAHRTPFGLSVTPDRRGPYDTPSLKAITAVIRANPVQTEG